MTWLQCTKKRISALGHESNLLCCRIITSAPSLSWFECCQKATRHNLQLQTCCSNSSTRLIFIKSDMIISAGFFVWSPPPPHPTPAPVEKLQFWMMSPNSFLIVFINWHTSSGSAGMSRSLTGVEERNSFHSCDRIVVLGQPGRDSTTRVCLCTTRFHCAPLNGAVLSACQHRYHS